MHCPIVWWKWWKQWDLICLCKLFVWTANGTITDINDPQTLFVHYRYRRNTRATQISVPKYPQAYCVERPLLGLSDCQSVCSHQPSIYTGLQRELVVMGHVTWGSGNLRCVTLCSGGSSKVTIEFGDLWKRNETRTKYCFMFLWRCWQTFCTHEYHIWPQCRTEMELACEASCQAVTVWTNVLCRWNRVCLGLRAGGLWKWSGR